MKNLSKNIYINFADEFSLSLEDCERIADGILNDYDVERKEKLVIINSDRVATVSSNTGISVDLNDSKP